MDYSHPLDTNSSCWVDSICFPQFFIVFYYEYDGYGNAITVLNGVPLTVLLFIATYSMLMS